MSVVGGGEVEINMIFILLVLDVNNIVIVYISIQFGDLQYYILF